MLWNSELNLILAGGSNFNSFVRLQFKTFTCPALHWIKVYWSLFEIPRKPHWWNWSGVSWKHNDSCRRLRMGDHQAECHVILVPVSCIMTPTCATCLMCNMFNVHPCESYDLASFTKNAALFATININTYFYYLINVYHDYAALFWALSAFNVLLHVQFSHSCKWNASVHK